MRSETIRKIQILTSEAAKNYAENPCLSAGVEIKTSCVPCARYLCVAVKCICLLLNRSLKKFSCQKEIHFLPYSDTHEA